MVNNKGKLTQREQLRLLLEAGYRTRPGEILPGRPTSRMNRMRSYLATMRPARIPARLERYRVPKYTEPVVPFNRGLLNMYTKQQLQNFLRRNSISEANKNLIRMKVGTINQRFAAAARLGKLAIQPLPIRPSNFKNRVAAFQRQGVPLPNFQPLPEPLYRQQMNLENMRRIRQLQENANRAIALVRANQLNQQL